jgi:hypothetical protein
VNKTFLFTLFLLLILPICDSFGATQTSLGDDLFIFVQSTVRNSDGTLVAYLESTKFTNLDLSGLESFLDFEASRGNDPVVSLDGKSYQVIRRVQSQSFVSDGVIASTILSDNVDGKPIILARFAHDGYPVSYGDTLESIWTFVRPVS